MKTKQWRQCLDDLSKIKPMTALKYVFDDYPKIKMFHFLASLRRRTTLT